MAVQFLKNKLRTIKKMLVKLLKPGSLTQPGMAEPAPLPEVAKPAPWLTKELDLDRFPINNDDTFIYNPFEIPVPNPILRFTVSEPELGKWLYIGAAWATVCSRYLPKNVRASVLDIGCGVGKTARFLVLNPLIDYCGFDIFQPSIDWCNREFPVIAGDRFRFEHFDGISAMYNPKGKIPSTEYIFPMGDESVDLAFAASLFTHLYEDDRRHYFEETRRVLKKRGVAVFSIHTLDDLKSQYPNMVIEPGMNFKGNEQVMFMKKEYFIKTAYEFGLSVKEEIGKVCGQETIAFEKFS
jgi:SAM-dependent methyltransferase